VTSVTRHGLVQRGRLYMLRPGPVLSLCTASATVRRHEVAEHRPKLFRWPIHTQLRNARTLLQCVLPFSLLQERLLSIREREIISRCDVGRACIPMTHHAARPRRGRTLGTDKCRPWSKPCDAHTHRQIGVAATKRNVSKGIELQQSGLASRQCVIKPTNKWIWSPY